MADCLGQRLRQAARALERGQQPEDLAELLLLAASALTLPPEPDRPALEQPEINSLVLEADGGSRGNPGPAGAGAVLRDATGRVIRQLHRFLGHTTNNVAEYQGLIMGLQAAAQYGAQSLVIKLDSELLVRQLQGRYQVKSPNLIPLYQQAKSLLSAFSQVRLMHIPREQNKLADALANQAMDQGC